jgi:hypothetical protein
VIGSSHTIDSFHLLASAGRQHQKQVAQPIATEWILLTQGGTGSSLYFCLIVSLLRLDECKGEEFVVEAIEQQPVGCRWAQTFLSFEQIVITVPSVRAFPRSR